MLNLDDLSDLVLIEIICRLPLASAAQCMCVSKRWFSLVSSNPYFVHCFLCVQSDNQKPILRILIFTNPRQPRTFFVTPSSSPFEYTQHNFNFLPCFQGPINTPEYEPIVVGAYDHLVLCCATMCFQCDYYICNPYIRQWDALPPAPPCHQEVRVGFICEPYYYYNYKKQQREEEDHRKEEVKEEVMHIRLNVEYRLVDGQSQLYGMLYWWSSSDGFVIGLDPYSNDSSNSAKYCFHFIDEPQDELESEYGRTFDFMGVSSRGRLRMCQYSPACVGDTDGDVSVWELKDDHQMDKEMDTDDVASACNDNSRWCLSFLNKSSCLPLGVPVVADTNTYSRHKPAASSSSLNSHVRRITTYTTSTTGTRRAIK
ncbi:hypothetical protein PRUPE_4G034700 [Prunus persica]|uniref:F-box domain-containing protein n=1 Tax=Prunus persica TaxID=3760 RepID=A0A251PF50_PRUPE|nr:hypothetical protein PRUPE_4G034700 [Prunus persica]